MMNGCIVPTVPDPSGSGRVDMLTSPVAAARAAVATRAWVKPKHDMYLIRGIVGKLYFTHPPEDKKKKKKKKKAVLLEGEKKNSTSRRCNVLFFTLVHGTRRYVFVQRRGNVPPRRLFPSVPFAASMTGLQA